MTAGSRPKGTVRTIFGFAAPGAYWVVSQNKREPARLSVFPVSRTDWAPTLGGLVRPKARLVQICEVSKRDTLFPANSEFHVCCASLSMSIAPQDLGDATA
jgi:hypothetical protein